ncbi:EF hand domain protein [Stachybotrys elegans]|uniref:EF hand domain protein n=1 Tax=Stachybotrys elegans TaxID=80388 RepID=A0A8K0SRQ1_9HYPO|nr:EF hand domain protein [Stachybotrys elegans]
MWSPTPSVESLTRPRIAVALVSAIAAISIGCLAYQSRLGPPTPDLVAGGLHRSNAVRRARHRRRGTASSTSSSSVPGDENLDINSGPPADNQIAIDDSGNEEWWNEPGSIPSNQRAGHNIVSLLFRVSEDNARRNGCVHRGCQCNSCGVIPIRGIRYRCANCADFDLCENCEAQGMHIKTHIFYKIRVPAPPFGARQMQPVWYTGDPDSQRSNLRKSVIPKLQTMTGFERPELEAFWEQWTYMANTEWRDDPDELCIAMDRKTFERCLVPTGGSRHASPNLIHDRMFSFYDDNNDSLIGFSEFVIGLSYRKQSGKLRKVFQGYDLDDDGYVSRRDFLRMFRAYYVLYKQMHKDILDGLKDELLSSIEAEQLVTSRQPLSSLFGRDGPLPDVDREVDFQGKTYNPDGSVEVAEGFEDVVVDDSKDTASRQDMLTSLYAYDTERTESQPRQLLISQSETDSRWRTVHQVDSTETDRAHLVNLLEPPSTLQELPEAIMGARVLGMDETEEEDTSEEEGDDADQNGPSSNNTISAEPTFSQTRAELIARRNAEAPALEKRRRDMARRQLHDRWRRRHFYLDEEEGGVAPEDWHEDEDILAHRQDGMSPAGLATPVLGQSQSTSKAQSAEDIDGFDTRSNASTSSSRGFVAGRWGRELGPEAENDAGKEILYQVTQQAFNELLDSIFKQAEDLAVQAAESKAQRQKFKHLIDALEAEFSNGEPPRPREESLFVDAEDLSKKSLEDLLAETGYTIKEQPPRNAVEIGGEDKQDSESAESIEASEAKQNDEVKDFTLPQFRPNSDAADPSLPELGPSYPVTNVAPLDSEADDQSTASTEEAPPLEVLQRWKRLEEAERNAEARGGWGLLTYEEFEAIYYEQEAQGNRLDYLGSWIDFCIR